MSKKISIKKYFERILIEKDKALNAALISSDKRLDLLNELRSGVATKDEVRALEKIVEDLKESRDLGKGKGAGVAQFIGWIIAAIATATALIGFLINNVKLK